MSRHDEVRKFLSEYAPDEFAARVYQRVESKNENWDASYEWASLSCLIGDGIRQAEDVAGYAAVLAARIEQDDGRSFADRRARALLASAAQRAAEADAMLAELRRLIERAA